ncbi:MAG: sigma-54-dependent Fis family transcriptional regulator, partial [Planctomycetota bacterium]
TGVDRNVNPLNQRPSKNLSTLDQDLHGFLEATLDDLRVTAAVDGVGLVAARDGQWCLDHWSGVEVNAVQATSSLSPTDQSGPASHESQSPADAPCFETFGIPEQWIADTVDSGRVQFLNRSADATAWCLLPLPAVDDPSRRLDVDSTALLLHGNWVPKDPTAPPDRLSLNDLRAQLEKRAPHFATSFRRVERNHEQSRRIDQLQMVLEASAEWRAFEDDDELLQAIAGTACSLMSCERASIFLWDRRRRLLVGRPALGVDGGVLEVPDDAGIVGEVLRTEQPQLWTEGSDQDTRINRDVDDSQDYKTKSLIAVPMRGQRGQLIGVFEAINHIPAQRSIDTEDLNGGQLDSGPMSSHHVGFNPLDAAVLSDLSLHAAVAIESLRTQKKLTRSRDQLIDAAASKVRLIGEDPAMETIRHSTAKVAGTDLSVLIQGQNGTGKEVLAKYIHFESRRRDGPFIAVNCAALVETLLESELFGHEKGAFTDAQATRIGKFARANGGTLVLDESGDMSPGGQAKLLRVLEERVVVRVGGSQTIPVDVRVIAATNQPLERLIQTKVFREDLFFRLNVVPLRLPALNERGEDILVLAEHFLDEFRMEIGRADLALSQAAKRRLMQHPWPGNVRELRNTMERVCYLTSGSLIEPDDLMLQTLSLSTERSRQAPNAMEPSTANLDGRDGFDAVDENERVFRIDQPLTDATKEFQIQHITRAIDAAGGNMTLAAEKLGLHRSNLYRKMRQLGMPTSGE